MLTVFIVFIFLADWRATLVPAATIPVSLIGTLAVMLGFGMSINTLSMFGLVLAIGIVVDDAIVVVENCVRLITEENFPQRRSDQAMQQVTGPIIATTLVLLAVFVPIILVKGITGLLYRQFALTLSVAVVFSSINALTLSPALCGSTAAAWGPNTAARFSGLTGWSEALLRAIPTRSKSWFDAQRF